MRNKFLSSVFHELDFWKVHFTTNCILLSQRMFFSFYLLTWWLSNKPDVDHGNSVHKHVWVMLLKKQNLTLIGQQFLLKLLCLMLGLHWYSMQAIIGLLFTHSTVDSSNVPPVFLGEKILNIVTRHVCNYFTWARVSIPSKSFFASAIIESNSIGAVCIFVTNVIDAFAIIDVWLKINRKKKLRQGEKILQKGSVKVDQPLCKVILFLICWLTSQVHVAINQLWTPGISWSQPILFTDAVFTFT